MQGDDPAACESRVVQLLGLDHFELAKELLKNRLKIVWVMKLRQAQDDAEVSSSCCCVSDISAVLCVHLDVSLGWSAVELLAWRSTAGRTC